MPYPVPGGFWMLRCGVVLGVGCGRHHCTVTAQSRPGMAPPRAQPRATGHVLLLPGRFAAPAQLAALWTPGSTCAHREPACQSLVLGLYLSLSMVPLQHQESAMPSIPSRTMPAHDCSCPGQSQVKQQLALAGSTCLC